jgi:hypothetical protein
MSIKTRSGHTDPVPGRFQAFSWAILATSAAKRHRKPVRKPTSSPDAPGATENPGRCGMLRRCDRRHRMAGRLIEVELWNHVGKQFPEGIGAIDFLASDRKRGGSARHRRIRAATIGSVIAERTLICPPHFGQLSTGRPRESSSVWGATCRGRGSRLRHSDACVGGFARPARCRRG